MCTQKSTSLLLMRAVLAHGQRFPPLKWAIVLKSEIISRDYILGKIVICFGADLLFTLQFVLLDFDAK